MVFEVIKRIIGWFILILFAVGFISVITISEYWSEVIISFVICFLFVIGMPIRQHRWDEYKGLI